MDCWKIQEILDSDQFWTVLAHFEPIKNLATLIPEKLQSFNGTPTMPLLHPTTAIRPALKSYPLPLRELMDNTFPIVRLLHIQHVKNFSIYHMWHASIYTWHDSSIHDMDMTPHTIWHIEWLLYVPYVKCLSIYVTWLFHRWYGHDSSIIWHIT